MQNIKTTFALILTGLLLGTAAHADVAWITDKLRLSMHEQPASKGKKIATLTSGTRVEILERNRLYAKVKTPDGLIGWVKGAYLEPVKPAKLRLTELERRHKRTLVQLADARDRLNKLLRDTQSIRTNFASERAELKSARELMEKYRTQNTHLRAKLDSYHTSIPISWTLGLMLGTLVIGTGLGIFLNDYRLRKRHGGFRL